MTTKFIGLDTIEDLVAAVKANKIPTWLTSKWYALHWMNVVSLARGAITTASFNAEEIKKRRAAVGFGWFVLVVTMVIALSLMSEYDPGVTGVAGVAFGSACIAGVYWRATRPYLSLPTTSAAADRALAQKSEHRVCVEDFLFRTRVFLERIDVLDLDALAVLTEERARALIELAIFEAAKAVVRVEIEEKELPSEVRTWSDAKEATKVHAGLRETFTTSVVAGQSLDMVPNPFDYRDTFAQARKAVENK